jgi:hypothetical protein
MRTGTGDTSRSELVPPLRAVVLGLSVGTGFGYLVAVGRHRRTPLEYRAPHPAAFRPTDSGTSPAAGPSPAVGSSRLEPDLVGQAGHRGGAMDPIPWAGGR